MKKFILLLAVAAVCSPLLVTSAQAKTAKLHHKAHKAHHAAHHARHHKHVA